LNQPAALRLLVPRSTVTTLLRRAFFSRASWGYDRQAWGGRNSAKIDFKGSHFERDMILWGVPAGMWRIR
jgi:hypothetical protein